MHDGRQRKQADKPTVLSAEGTFDTHPFCDDRCRSCLLYTSEAMGHSSITVTETYLKPFRSRKIDEANNRIVDFVKLSIGGIIV